MKKRKLQDELAALTTKHGELLRQTESEGADVIALLAQSDAIEAEISTKKAELAAIEKLEEKTRQNAELAAAAAPRAEVRERILDKPWTSLGEQMQAVVTAAKRPHATDPRLLQSLAASGLNETVGSDGGFLVQTDFSSELLKRAYETGQIASRCRKVPISSNANGLRLNALDETSRANGSRFGGVQAYWENEADATTASKPKFRTMELYLKKLMGLCHATEELLADASALGSVLSQGFGEEFGFKIDDAIINGTGAGQPLGYMNSAALVSVAKESSQVAATVVVENVFKMRARLWARSRANSVWLINQDIEPQLHSMTLGSTGQTPVFMPAGGVSGMPFDTLYGRPIIPIEQAATLGTVGDIALVDLSQYLLIDKGGLNAATSLHVRFLNDEQTFRFILRIDGQPIWNAPLTPYKGSATQSPFVVLATRS
jgi:HK97 family phage major capsid protein